MKSARVYPVYLESQRREFSRRGFAQIIIVAIVMLLVGASAFAYWRLKTIPRYPFNTNDVISPPADETVYPDSIGANWKTYKSTKLGFKFKYPQDWDIEKETDSGVIISAIDYGYGTAKVRFTISEDNATKKVLRNKINSYPVNKEVQVPLDNPEGAVRPYDIYKRLEDKSVDNYPTLRYTIDFGYKDMGVNDQYPVTIIKGTKLIDIHMDFTRKVENRSESKVEFIDKILSTFQFLN